MKINLLAIPLLLMFVLSGCASNKIVKTPSGFNVLFHSANKGKKPEAREWVYFTYSISVRDSVLDYSKVGQPLQRIQMPDQITSAEPSYYVLEAFELVTQGDSISLYVPISIMPGPKPEFFKENDTLEYAFKIVSIKTQAEYDADLELEQKEAMEKQQKAMEKFEPAKAQLDLFVAEYKSGKMKSKLTDGPGGLKVYYIKEGEGENIKAGQSVDAHYIGSLTDGTIFDASYQRGSTINFTVGNGQVISGWDEGFQLLKAGAEAIIFIPAAMAYGQQGSGMIPPNADLIFHVAVDQVN